RQSGNHVQIHMPNSDCDSLDFFQNGKPGIDQVNELAFVPGANGDLALLATAVGVAEFDADTFAYKRLRAAEFGECEHVTAVKELVYDGAKENSRRPYARLSNGQAFEFRDDKWIAATNLQAVQDVFDISYRSVYQPNLWEWSRYPSGLTCKLLE